MAQANSPPIIASLTAQSRDVLLGQSVSLAAQASDPDGDTLSLLWSATGGSIAGTGMTAVWTAPLQGGPYGVSLTVTDSPGASATRSLTLLAVPARHLFTIPTPGRPARVAVDSQGDIYASLPERGEVRIYDADGKFLDTIQDLWKPLGIAVDGGRVYVGDEGFKEVRVFDAAGTFLMSLGSGRGEVSKPGDIAVDPLSGRVYVSDGAEGLVKVYSSSTGEILFSFGRPGEGDAMLYYPEGLGILPSQGKVLVTDFDASSIKAYDLITGEFRWVLGPYTAPIYLDQGCFPPPCAPQPSTADSLPARLEGVAVDRNGWVYAAEAGLSVVEVFDANGNFLAILGGEGSGPGQLKIPTDVAIDSQDRLIVADAGNSRIQAYGLAGYFSRNPVVTPPPQEPPPVVLGIPGSRGAGGFGGRGIGCTCSIGGGGGIGALLNLLPWVGIAFIIALLRKWEAS